MKREERAAHWLTIIERYAGSGLSAAAFCREHCINLNRFYWWRRRFHRTDQRQIPNSTSTGFLELVSCSKQPESGIRIRLGEDLSIEVDQGFDPLTLRGVIETLCRSGKR